MEKLRVILDLDQTVISAEPEEDYDFEGNKRKATKFKWHDMDGYYLVFERPGLQPFLDFLFKHFTVSIWTAATKDYALFIAKNVILANRPERTLDWIMFSYHCDLSKHARSAPKDLCMVWDHFQLPGYTRENTVIIDDNDLVHASQPGHCIIAPPFEFTSEGSEKDDFLFRLKKDLEGTTPCAFPAAAINHTTATCRNKSRDK